MLLYSPFGEKKSPEIFLRKCPREFHTCFRKIGPLICRRWTKRLSKKLRKKFSQGLRARGALSAPRVAPRGGLERALEGAPVGPYPEVPGRLWWSTQSSTLPLLGPADFSADLIALLRLEGGGVAVWAGGEPVEVGGCVFDAVFDSGGNLFDVAGSVDSAFGTDASGGAVGGGVGGADFDGVSA